MKRTLDVSDEFNLNDEQRAVLDYCFDERSNVFITGQAGSGKSHLIKAIIMRAMTEDIQLSVTATTGCAASLLDGTTIHSFMGTGLGDKPADDYIKFLRKNEFKVDQLQSVKILIIDEISMMDYTFFEKCNTILKSLRYSDKPFGGIQLIMVGDFFQLPPVQKGVKTPTYLFETKLWEIISPKVFCLKSNHRQSEDKEYSSFLNRMRDGSLTKSDFEKVNETISRNKYNPNSEDTFIPSYLHSKKESADIVNNDFLKRLTTQEMHYAASGFNIEKIKSSSPVPESLTLKIGAIVILVKNLNVSIGLYNGRKGIVSEFDPETHHPIIKFENGVERTIGPETWELKNPKKGNNNPIARMTQIPLILAYALTVHKTQGMTLDKIVLNPGFFADGHAYVAFSRVKNLQGIYLNEKEHGLKFEELKTSQKVVDFYKKYQ
jgi:ATP-dependent DNA helicase PIF1